MCGIFGCVGKIHREKAFQCIGEIKHRGPDAIAVKDLGAATLAHARLTIMDISENANQPMTDVSGRYWIVYNGEVYNFHELRRELEALGYRFRTSCDTEVVLYSYIAWGTDFQKKCNGMWSMAIWDSVEKSLFISRDRFGVKPFYYYEQDGNFYFASEMKALFPVMSEKKINYSVFERKDYLGFEEIEECNIKGIKKILPGHCGYLKNGHLRVSRWWNTLDHLVEAPSRYEEQTEYFRELLLDACRIRMRSDVPIGTALSGGLDSSAIVGAMKYSSSQGDEYANKDWQHTFVASMPGTFIDETDYARSASKYIGVNINEIVMTDKVNADQLLHYMYICEEPYTTSPIPFFQTYSAIAEAGIRVTLDGHGADELFGGYKAGLYSAAKGCRRDHNELIEIWRIFNDTVPTEYQLSFDAFLEIADHRRLEKSKDEDHAAWKCLDEYNRRLYVETHERILPTLLRCYDRYSMGNGVEIRMPFMDYRIVCYAFSIPWSSKLRNGYTKAIVRDAAAPFMDRGIIYRKFKIGFNSPMTEWLQNGLKEFLLDTVYSKDFKECELIDADEIIQMVDFFYKEKRKHYGDGEKIWKEIVPYLWKKAMIAS